MNAPLIRSPLASEVRRVRKALGLSQAEFAERIGASRTSVGAWEAARAVPAPEFEATLARLGVKASFNRVRVKTDRRFRGRPPGSPFGALLRRYRTLRDVSAEALAERIGVDTSTISNWETGRAEPRAYLFILTCDTLSIPLDAAAEAIRGLQKP